MDQDELFAATIDRINQRSPLTEVAVDSELARPSAFMKLVEAEHLNWSSDDFRKVFGMRFRVKVPPLDQLNIITYPAPNKDVPIFIFFCMLTKRKIIAHVNVNCAFDDEMYQSQYIKPLTNILNTYESFATKDRNPEWMQNYANDCTIYGLYPRERYEDIQNLALQYAEHYMTQVAAAPVTTDPDRLQRLAEFQAGFVDDIRTKDKAQGMIAKMLGKDKTRRIFYEVTT